MNSLIFGSTAAHHWFPEFRKPKDLDVISREECMTESRQHYWVDSFQEILNKNKDEKYVDPDFLYTIKVSHAGFDIYWQKTMFDILFFKRNGCKLDAALYKKLVKDWTALHGRRWAKLEGKDSTSFFEDAVKRKYVHDDIHEAVAVYDRPLYEKILKNPESGSVSCSEEKFHLLSEKDKELLVREEVWVTAIERYLVPFGRKYGLMRAYSQSLKKLCTTMSSGWFKMWILDNFDRLYKFEDDSFVKRFEEAEKNNELKLNHE